MTVKEDEIITEQVEKIVQEFSVPYIMRKYRVSHQEATKFMVGKKPTNSWDVVRG